MAARKSMWIWLSCILGGFVVTPILAIVVVRLFVGWFLVIPQNGMYPGLPAGSRVFALKQPYADVSKIARGDIVIFERHENGQRYLFIWRVVGLPGETVTVDGEKLLVDGKEVLREKVRSEGGLQIFRESNGDAVYEVAYGPKQPADIPRDVKVTVPPDGVFVMGDNRHHAVDSRTYGPVLFSSIVAKKW